MVNKFITQFKDLYINLKSSSAKGEVARNTISSSMVKVGAIGLSFLQQLTLARLMGAERFGDYTFVWSWVTTLIVFGTLGFNIASLRFVATYKASSQWSHLKGFLQRAYLLTTSLSLVLIALFTTVIFFLRQWGKIEPYLANLFWLASPLLIAYAFLELQSGILRGGGFLTRAITYQMIGTPSLILLSVLGFAVINGVSGILQTSIVLLVNLFAVLIIVIVQGIDIRRKFSPVFTKGLPSSYNDRLWLGVTSSMMITAGFQRVNNHLDVLIVGGFVGRTEAGIYMVAAKLISLISLSLEITNTASAHVFARLHGMGQRAELQSVVRLAARIAFTVGIPILVVLGLWADKILFIFGKEFIDGMLVLRVLLIGELLNLITGPNGILLSMTGHHRLLAWILSGTVILNAGLALLTVRAWGVVGIAASRSLAQLFRNGVGVAEIWRSERINTTVFLPIIPKAL